MWRIENHASENIDNCVEMALNNSIVAAQMLNGIIEETISWHKAASSYLKK
jgi:hypothetical protein